MKSKWSEEEAARYREKYRTYGEDQALRVYTSRLLGRDSTLVLHGGGNTSVKTTVKDDLGRDVPVLCVKGSGWDMAQIEPAGLPAVALDPLRSYQALQQLSDEAMVNACRRHLLNTGSPTPSVETLLHAFLPHKFIDHTHADTVLAVVNQPNAEEVSRKIWGQRMAIVPYIMPGFQLSKKALEIYEENPDVEGLILINHGIFTFGDTARQAYERMIEGVTQAEEYLESHARETVAAYQPLELEQEKAHYLPLLRGRLMNHATGIGPLVLHWRRSNQIEAWLSHERLEQIATRGPITPDHIIRTKQKPLILEATGDEEQFRSQLETALDHYVTAYKEYYQTQSKARNVERTQLHPLPVVFLIRGLGLVTMGTTMKAARVAADLYEHTIETILKAESVGSFQALPDGELFDMEYWTLEQAKLGKKKARPMEGRITLISGAAGGIGAATARHFAAMGSNLVLTDLTATQLDDMSQDLQKEHGITAIYQQADITNQAQAEQVVARASAFLGGLDVIVSNAGVAPSGPIHEATAQLENSLKINLLSHQYLASAATQVMLSQGLGGCLLFNASKSAFNPGPGFGAYSIPKAALIALMKQYAVEFAGAGIRASAVNADRIRTPLFDTELLAARAKARGLTPDAYFKANLLGQEVYPQDVAQAFYHLYASAKTTGSVLAVDGGNIAASPR